MFESIILSFFSSDFKFFVAYLSLKCRHLCDRIKTRILIRSLYVFRVPNSIIQCKNMGFLRIIRKKDVGATQTSEFEIDFGTKVFNHMMIYQCEEYEGKEQLFPFSIKFK